MMHAASERDRQVGGNENLIRVIIIHYDYAIKVIKWAKTQQEFYRTIMQKLEEFRPGLPEAEYRRIFNALK